MAALDKGPLGALYFPSYFTSTGIAIHGSTSVPATPVSHGCVRVPRGEPEQLAFRTLAIGRSVYVLSA